MGFTMKSGYLEWTGRSDLIAEEILVSPRDSSPRMSKVDEVNDWLFDQLSHGTVSKNSIISKARKVGITRATLRRAAKKLKIESKRISKVGSHRGAGEWVWGLPGSFSLGNYDFGGHEDQNNEHLEEGKYS